AANREVSREEDIAYSLMGVCDLSISIAYGEGAKRAFYRLMTELGLAGEHAKIGMNLAIAHSPSRRAARRISLRPL
ncbi:hypothetical protein BJ912DRAFT_865679, partial [Pholiota molesta]